MSDATFDEGAEAPLRLKALDAEDLAVVSGLAQDAVFTGDQIRWDRAARRFAILLNRFRWEDVPRAEARLRDYERVQSVLLIEDALRVRTQGVDPKDGEVILSLLALAFTPGGRSRGSAFVSALRAALATP